MNKLLPILCIAISCQSIWHQNVIDQVTRMETLMVETQLTGNYQKQFELYSDDYGYIDISGKRVTKEQLANRRAEDHFKAISLVASELKLFRCLPP